MSVYINCSVDKLRQLYRACPFKPSNTSLHDGSAVLDTGDFLCMRTEGTHFSIADYTGGCIVNGKCFVSAEVGYGMKLIVRSDFLKWVNAQLKEEARAARVARAAAREKQQMSLGV